MLTSEFIHKRCLNCENFGVYTCASTARYFICSANNPDISIVTNTEDYKCPKYYPIRELIPKMRKGAKVRRADTFSAPIYLKNGKFEYSHGESLTFPYLLTPEDLEATDWEIVDESEVTEESK